MPIFNCVNKILQLAVGISSMDHTFGRSVIRIGDTGCDGASLTGSEGIRIRIGIIRSEAFTNIALSKCPNTEPLDAGQGIRHHVRIHLRQLSAFLTGSPVFSLNAPATLSDSSRLLPLEN
jgi:hypothetical protein